MPRVTGPVPELTVRGTVRKNRIYTSEDDIQRALQMVRDGVYMARAARLCNIPVKRLVKHVNELKARNEVEIYWGKNAPGYLANIQEQDQGTPEIKLQQQDQERPEAKLHEEDQEMPETSDIGGKKKKKKYNKRKYSEENYVAAIDAVKSGMYTANAAHHIFNVDGHVLYKLLKEDRKEKPPKEKHRSLTEQEEQCVVDYALALDKVGVQVTCKSLVSLASQYVIQRGGKVIKDKNTWAKSFVLRHQELRNIFLTPSALKAVTQEQHLRRTFSRLTEVYDKYNFHDKPSRVYACGALQFYVERWEGNKPNIIDVEMLVAANATGYHTLPPCVVYANEEDHGIPDFLELPEAGFVISEEKKVTAPIMLEWFQSVLLHYLPPRTLEDPVILLIKGDDEWLSAELLNVAEQEHVHLVPMWPQISWWCNPLQSLLVKLRQDYKAALHDYKAQLSRQVPVPTKGDFFPVKMSVMFSYNFIMHKIQQAFKSTGVFPLKPYHINIPKEELIWRELAKAKTRAQTNKVQITPEQPERNAKEAKVVSKESNTVPTKLNQEMKLISCNSDQQSTNNSENFVLKVADDVVLNSDGTHVSPSHGEEMSAVMMLLESMQKSPSATVTTDKVTSPKANLDTASTASSTRTMPIITSLNNPPIIIVPMSSATATSSQPTISRTSTSSSDTVMLKLKTKETTTAVSEEDGRYETNTENSILPKNKSSSQLKTTDPSSLSGKCPGDLAPPVQTAVSSSSPQQCVTLTSSVAIAGTTSVSATPNSVQNTSVNLPHIPAKIPKLNENVGESFDASATPSLSVLSNAPDPPNASPAMSGASKCYAPGALDSKSASTGDALHDTDDPVASVSSPSTGGVVESDSVDQDFLDNLNMNEAPQRTPLTNTPSISTQSTTTASSSLLGFSIQTVTKKNTQIVSLTDGGSKPSSKKLATKSAGKSLEPICNQLKLQAGHIPTMQSSIQTKKSLSLLPNLSVVAAKLQQHVLSQKPKSTVPVQMDPQTLLRFAKDAGLNQSDGAVQVTKQMEVSDDVKSNLKSGQTVKALLQTRKSTKANPSQVSPKLKRRKSRPSHVSAARGSGLASRHAQPTASVSGQQQQVSESQAHLKGNLSKIAQAFNPDVASTILALKNCQNEPESQIKPQKKTKKVTSPPKQSNKQAQPQTSASSAASAPPVVPTTPVVHIGGTTSVPVYNQIQQTPHGHILLMAGTGFPLVQQPLVIRVPQGAPMVVAPCAAVTNVAPALKNAKNHTPIVTALTSAPAAGSTSTSGDSPTICVPSVTNVTLAVTNTNLTPTVTAKSAPATVSASPSIEAPTMEVPSVTNVAPTITNTNPTPSVAQAPTCTSPASKASASSGERVTFTSVSASPSYTVKAKVTSDSVTIVTIEKPKETIGSISRKPRKQALDARIEPGEIPSEMDKRDSQRTSVKKSPRDKVSSVEASPCKSNLGKEECDASVRKSQRQQGQVATKELNSKSSQSSAGTLQICSSGTSSRKSPRKQVVVTREDLDEVGPSAPTKVDMESQKATHSKKRKASLASAVSKMAERKVDSHEEAKKLKLGAQALTTERRKTRAQAKEDSLPSRKTRSIKR